MTTIHEEIKEENVFETFANGNLNKTDDRANIRENEESERKNEQYPLIDKDDIIESKLIKNEITK